jgi:PPE-SVP subfamily C-terminal region
VQNTLANSPQGAFGLGLTNANLNTLRQVFQAYFGVGLGNFGWSILQQSTFGPGGATAGAGGAWYPTPQFAGLGGGFGGFGGPPVSAGIGQASTLGRLSVPPGFPGATPSAMEEGPVLASSVRPIAPTSNALLNGMPMGSGLANGRRGGQFVVRYGFRHSVMPRPPSAG